MLLVTVHNWPVTSSHLIHLIIHGCSELFHPSTTTSTTTTPLPTTSTQALPIKSHELGWDLAPVDLVMANSVLEPVFSADQRQVLRQYSLNLNLSDSLLQDVGIN